MAGRGEGPDFVYVARVSVPKIIALRVERTAGDVAAEWAPWQSRPHEPVPTRPARKATA